MALSPNYGWAEPDNASLVKNGAQDIRALGDAIDTSVWNVGYGQAGKNKVMNGDFSINQRSFSSTTTSADYNFDRWRTIYTGGTSTTSAQVFTPGAAPVAGYEGKNYYSVAITGQSAVTDNVRMQETVEGVRTFAGQTTTYSFWAKASAGTPKVAVISVQFFGTGGSPSATVTTEHGTVTLSTSWARYSVSVAMPSISGKTIGTDNNDSVSVRLLLSAGTSVSGNQSIGVQNYTFETWGHQWEYGSKATPFQTASGGSPQSELAMCQRYYYEDAPLVGTLLNTTLLARSLCLHPVEMRTAPTVTISNATTFLVGALTATATGSITSYSTARFLQADVTIGLTASAIGSAGCRISGSGKITVSAEL
jgi:hypothetical protein